MPGFGTDIEIALHQSYTLSHADNSQAGSGQTNFRVKPYAVIVDVKVNTLRASAYTQLDLIRLRVFRHVVQSFLCNTVEAGCNSHGQRSRYRLVLKFHYNPFSGRKLIA